MNRAFLDSNYDPDPGVSLFGIAPETLDLELLEPLSALRHCLRELGEALDEDPERGALLGNALEHLADIDRCASTVAEYASPAPLELEACCLSDLANQALAQLPLEQADQVRLEIDQAEQLLTTDPGLFASRLASLLSDAATHSNGTALLHVHADPGVAYFSIIEAESRLERSPVSPESLLALRDFERMGAELSVQLNNPKHRCVIVRVAIAPMEIS